MSSYEIPKWEDDLQKSERMTSRKAEKPISVLLNPRNTTNFERLFVQILTGSFPINVQNLTIITFPQLCA